MTTRQIRIACCGMADWRLVLCERCQSEGRILRSNGGPDDIDHGECPDCEGTGREIVEVFPIEMEDLTWIYGTR